MNEGVGGINLSIYLSRRLCLALNQGCCGFNAKTCVHHGTNIHQISQFLSFCSFCISSPISHLLQAVNTLSVPTHDFPPAQGGGSDAERTKKKKRGDRYSVQTSLIVAALKKMLPIGLNMCSPADQELINMAKIRYSLVLFSESPYLVKPVSLARSRPPYGGLPWTHCVPRDRGVCWSDVTRVA